MFYGDKQAADRLIKYLPDSLGIPSGKYKANTQLEFAAHVLNGTVREKGEMRLNYKFYVFKRSNTEKNEYDILKKRTISPTLVQLLDSSGSKCHCITILGDYIFDANQEKTLPLTAHSLNI